MAIKKTTSKKKIKSVAKKKSKKSLRKPVRRRIKPAPRKKAPKKQLKKETKAATVPKPTVIAPPNSVLLGYVEDYYAKIGVVALHLENAVSQGAHLHVVGFTTNFEQPLDSMQMDHQPVTLAKPGDAVGFKVKARTRRGDHVYLIKPA